jgi:phage gp36-like protein
MVLKDDILNYIDSDDLQQITESDDSIIDVSILDAEQIGSEYLINRFDIDFEYSQTGTARNSSLLKHLTAIALFFLFERLNTNILPESRSGAYDRAIQWLKDVRDQKIQTNLKEKTAPENEKGFGIRWGSTEKQINTKL